MNVKPKNYSWPEFYDHVIDVTRYAFSWPRIVKRFYSVKYTIPKWMNVVRAISSEGFGRIKYFTMIRSMLENDKQFRDYFEQESDEIPPFYKNRIKNDLGDLWEWLPNGDIQHDPNAYLNSTKQESLIA